VTLELLLSVKDGTFEKAVGLGIELVNFQRIIFWECFRKIFFLCNLQVAEEARVMVSHRLCLPNVMLVSEDRCLPESVSP
jgi:hypothetical protein